MQGGINPSFCFEIQQILMEEEITQREKTQEDGVGDVQPLGENPGYTLHSQSFSKSLGIPILLHKYEMNKHCST